MCSNVLYTHDEKEIHLTIFPLSLPPFVSRRRRRQKWRKEQWYFSFLSLYSVLISSNWKPLLCSCKKYKNIFPGINHTNNDWMCCKYFQNNNSSSCVLFFLYHCWEKDYARTTWKKMEIVFSSGNLICITILKNYNFSVRVKGERICFAYIQHVYVLYIPHLKKFMEVICFNMR